MDLKFLYGLIFYTVGWNPVRQELNSHFEYIRAYFVHHSLIQLKLSFSNGPKYGRLASDPGILRICLVIGNTNRLHSVKEKNKSKVTVE